MFTNSMIVLKHLLVRTHVEISFKLVEVAELKLTALYYTAYFNRITVVDGLILCLVVVHNLDLFL